MVSFDVIMTDRAVMQLEEYVDYLQYTLLNEQAADAVWQDELDTITRLKTVAGSLRLCNNPKLQGLGYHLIRFKRHRYIMIYHLDGFTAYVDAVDHQLQDYEGIFTKDLEDENDDV